MAHGGRLDLVEGSCKVIPDSDFIVTNFSPGKLFFQILPSFKVQRKSHLKEAL